MAINSKRRLSGSVGSPWPGRTRCSQGSRCGLHRHGCNTPRCLPQRQAPRSIETRWEGSGLIRVREVILSRLQADSLQVSVQCGHECAHVVWITAVGQLEVCHHTSVSQVDRVIVPGLLGVQRMPLGLDSEKPNPWSHSLGSVEQRDIGHTGYSIATGRSDRSAP